MRFRLNKKYNLDRYYLEGKLHCFFGFLINLIYLLKLTMENFYTHTQYFSKA